MTDVSHGGELAARLEKLASLLPEIEQFPDIAIREKTREMVQAVLEFHAVAIERIFDRLEEAGAVGHALVDELSRDDLVSSLLVLHDLHPLDLPARVERAIVGVRPLLGSHGGDVELLDISSTGEVRLRLAGNCNGCPSSRTTLESTILSAIYAAAPEVTKVHVEGAEAAPPATAGFVPLSNLAVQRS